MAGERKGTTYEAILALALRELQSRSVITEDIHWNITPAGMTIEPDFTVGKSSDAPSIVILANHSGSAAESHKKLWRNLGELAEAKTSLPRRPLVYSIMFDATVKQDLKLIQDSAFDGQIVVGDLPWGATLTTWVDSNATGLPRIKEERVEALEDIVKSQKGGLHVAYKSFVKELEKLMSAAKPELDRLWDMARKHSPMTLPTEKYTHVRRGLSKAALLGGVPSSSNLSALDKATQSLLIELGIARRSIGGLRLADEDVLWLMSSIVANADVKDMVAQSSQGFRDQLAKVMSIELIVKFCDYMAKHASELCTTAGMLRHLRQQHADPASGLVLGSKSPRPADVWLFDVICALSKAQSGKSQAFGYSHFSKHRDSESSKIGKMTIGAWCACFMNQYFSRKHDFDTPSSAEQFVAKVLADEFKRIASGGLGSKIAKIREMYVAKEYEATLMAHNGFDPIGYLICKSLGVSYGPFERIRGAFAERSDAHGQAGSTEILRVRNTLINWQSVTDAGRDHKKKELCGRAVALRFSWDKATHSFVKRPGVRRLVLVLDGTWRQADINALGRAGWDCILFADEVDKLVAIVV